MKTLLALMLVAAACGSSSYPTVHGSIVIEADCNDLGGYSDIPFMQPVLRTVDGDFITELQPNPFNGTTPGTSGKCLAAFSADDVPHHDKYMLDAGRRGEHIINSDDFEYLMADNEPSIFKLTIGQ